MGDVLHSGVSSGDSWIEICHLVLNEVGSVSVMGFESEICHLDSVGFGGGDGRPARVVNCLHVRVGLDVHGLDLYSRSYYVSAF